MGRAGAGQADDHDRRGDRDVEDLGVAVEQVLDEQPVAAAARTSGVVAHDAER